MKMHEEIVKHLDAEITKLILVKELLSPGAIEQQKPGKRKLSLEGRKNIALAQKKRWAKARKSA